MVVPEVWRCPERGEKKEGKKDNNLEIPKEK